MDVSLKKSIYFENFNFLFQWRHNYVHKGSAYLNATHYPTSAQSIEQISFEGCCRWWLIQDALPIPTTNDSSKFRITFFSYTSQNYLHFVCPWLLTSAVPTLNTSLVAFNTPLKELRCTKINVFYTLNNVNPPAFSYLIHIVCIHPPYDYVEYFYTFLQTSFSSKLISSLQVLVSPTHNILTVIPLKAHFFTIFFRVY